MSKRIVFGIPIIFVGLGVFGWLAWPSDEEQIEALFEELSEVASKTEDASTLSDAMVVKDFKKLFAPKVVISIRSKARIAGEHTNPLFWGCVHGALVSAYREAARITVSPPPTLALAHTHKHPLTTKVMTRRSNGRT